MTDEDRRARGRRVYREVMVSDPPAPDTPYTANGVIDAVFGELWDRPGLARRDRRWITLACVGASGAPVTIESHVRAALASGEITLAEMHEFVLHFAYYHGWPRASTVHGIVVRVAAELGLPAA